MILPPAFTPQLQLETLFILNGAGRILSTREPDPTRGPEFALVRGWRACAWAIHADVPREVARDLDDLARTESPALGLTDPPRHAAAYIGLLGGTIESGPVFTFPEILREPGDVRVVTSLSELERHFRGWTASEIPERSPILGIVIDDYPVSICFCARSSNNAAEAGVETAIEFRRRGFGARVTAAWAQRIRDSGRLALYSTSWNNAASRAVARTLGLDACAADWNVTTRRLAPPG